MSDRNTEARERILALKAQRKIITIETAALGPVRIRELSFAAGQLMRPYVDTPQFDVAYFIGSVVGDDGEPVFELNAESMAEIEELPLTVIIEVVTAAAKLNHQATSAEIKN